MKTKTLLLGFIVGGIAAGVTTLLSAPASGKETRNYIKENSNQWRNQLLDLKISLLDLKNSTTSATKEGKEVISTFISDVKILLADWQEDINPNQEQLKFELNSIQETVNELESQIQADQSILVNK
ncbi:YtxH domain-containing protein [Bacillus sp. 31A1R]|uniref:YtxH domain-containing protein n=1 Tax=Robertmurraya mangrovi TaxID=3098077 RepID=A0ABU5ISS9_9BACI|nr:YtxH domain-containing protein [Bacillus sp. 31A1R]MDZ5470205.1 YtxH domain-containing protein [Bacillus sp. 31A1R]